MLKSLDLGLWIKWEPMKDLRATERSHLIRFYLKELSWAIVLDGVEGDDIRGGSIWEDLGKKCESLKLDNGGEE